MAAKPTPGGSDGTYGTELNAFLDVSLAADGKIKDGAVLEAATEAADPDRTITDLAAVRSAGFPEINGTPTAVFTKYFTGTTDNDASTSVAHGITGVDNILAVDILIGESASVYSVMEFFQTGSPSVSGFVATFDATNITLATNGSTPKNKKYRIKIDFML